MESRTFRVNFALENQKADEPGRLKPPKIERLKNPHIKVDWETLQIILKSRDKLSIPMAGLNFRKKVSAICRPDGLQRYASTQILSYRSFIASFGVELILDRTSAHPAPMPGLLLFTRQEQDPPGRNTSLRLVKNIITSRRLVFLQNRFKFRSLSFPYHSIRIQ